MLKGEYDATADALYLRLGAGDVERTEQVDAATLVDLDRDGNVLGIEVIHPARQWPLTLVLARYRLAAADREMLLTLFPKPGRGLVSFPARDQLVGARQQGELVAL